MFSSALKSLSSNISSNYHVSPHPTVVSGPWKIHDGKKKSTGTTASIFIFDKKFLEPRSSGLGSRSSSSTKKLQEDVVERLKREASNLARLRHPSVLQVLEPVEDTRNGGLMFATEQVTASLAGLLQAKDAQDNTSRIGSRSSRYMVEEPDGTRRRRDLEIDELEIQKGLLQVAKGLEFLHESAGLVHGNLNPEAIYINAKSDWKISGLGFAGPSGSAESRSTLPPLALSEVLYQDPRLPQSVQLNLDYTSPDFVLDSNVTPAADLFSLGLIIVALYNSPHVSPLQTHSNVNTYKKLLGSPSSTPSQGNNFLSSGPIPKDVVSHVLPRLITRRPAQRLNAREFQQSQYFDNILVSTIRFLESLPAKNANEKSQFMRGLQRVLPEFPVSVLERKVLGALLEETKDRELLPLILTNVFAILQRIPNARRTFPERVIPQLKEAFPTSKGALQERDSKKDAGLMVVLENMNVVSDNCSGNEFKEEILPLIRLGLDSPTHSLVDGAIKCLPVILPVLDFSTVKNEVFPPIASTFSRTNSLAIKVRCLEAFAILCGGSMEGKEAIEDDLSGVSQKSKPQSIKSSILDKYTIQEKLVPSMKVIKTKEPAVMMAALNVFRQIGMVADTDFLALEVLPILWSFSLGPLLDLRQFGEFMTLIKSVSSKIEREQTKKLQELSLGGDSGGFQNGTGSSSTASTSVGQPNVDNTRGNFERLVLGRGAATSNDQNIDQWGSLTSGPPVSQSTTQMTPSTGFSWASASASPAVKGTSMLPSQTNLSMRSVTPDYNMSTFPSLEPATRAKSPPTPAFPTLQPSPSSSWSIPSPPTNQQSTQRSNVSGLSLGALASMKAHAPMPSQGTQPVPSYSAFSIPPPPSGYSTMGAFGGPSGLANTGGPAFGTSVSSNAFLNNSAPQGTQKQGLDKYESLL
ncbi:protein kinase Scy1 [Aspergillus sclerotioniger CBS 115572]|uniref:Protein kinase Scy1 n=1 Tax=Aspergillus sclerotioniger CBS 115572 TaxID=1450535 RepID=A0A317X5C5_9EURO|nr:protein kinase Scy1 [Aspergillus sclerotioniger CBS 115572]PWY93814.1 protein kinase Scy1 [Aspergillus sclerotioniger CBS 115572]